MTHVPEIGAENPTPENWYHKPARKYTMSYLLPETDTREIRYQITCHTFQIQKPVPVYWY